MFKEAAVEKLIEYMQALPMSEQNLIIQKVAKDRKTTAMKKASRSKKRFEEMNVFLDNLGTRLPENFKFNREEANER